MATLEGTFKKDFTEPKKIAVSWSRTTSMLKSLIHVVPVGFALFEIITNLQGRYLGDSFDKHSYYQLVAKMHEILIDASLASIVLSFIRRETAQHDGVPFGAFLGGLQFLSISYLWLRELWSSVFTTSWHLRSRATFLLLIIVSGIIAATAGPSSATLLIPRELLWQLPSTYSAINGTMKDIWPTELDPVQIPKDCSTLNDTSSDPSCLASNWQGIYDEIEVQLSIVGNNFDNPNFQVGGGFELNIQAASSTDQIFATYLFCPFNGESSPDTQICGSTQANILNDAAFSDNSIILSQDKDSSSDIYHRVDTSIYSAYTAIRCYTNNIQGPKDTTSLRFPGLSRTLEEYKGGAIETVVETPSKAEIYATSGGNLSEFLLLWIDLPENLFG